VSKNRLTYHVVVASLLAILMGSGCGGGGKLAENGSPADSSATGSVAINIRSSSLTARSALAIDASAAYILVSVLDFVTGGGLIEPVRLEIPTDGSTEVRTTITVRVGLTRILVRVFALGDTLVGESSTLVNVVEGFNTTVTTQPQPVVPKPTPTPTATPTPTPTATPGRFLLVTNHETGNPGSLDVFQANPDDGSLLHLSNNPIGTDPKGVAVAGTASNRYVFVANFQEVYF